MTYFHLEYSKSNNVSIAKLVDLIASNSVLVLFYGKMLFLSITSGKMRNKINQKKSWSFYNEYVVFI